MTKPRKTTPTDTDQLGLAPEVAVPKLVPALQPGDLGVPVVAKYTGYEIKKSRQFNREQRLYQFQLPQEFGSLKFSLWAQTQLDLKLGQTPRNSIILIQYMGRGEGDRAQHNWTVRPFRGTSAQLAELVARHSEGCGIAQQAASMLAQSMDGNAAHNNDDDDLPF